MSGVGGGTGGGGSGGGGDGGGGGGNEVAAKLAKVEEEMEELKSDIKKHGTGDGDWRGKLLVGLQEKENQLRAEQQQREQRSQAGECSLCSLRFLCFLLAAFAYWSHLGGAMAHVLLRLTRCRLGWLRSVPYLGRHCGEGGGQLV